MEKNYLRVANTTNVQKLATAIVKNLEEKKDVVLSCIGVQAISQAMKSVAIATSKVAPEGFVLTVAPSFRHIDKGTAVERTVLDLTVLPRMIQ